MIILSYVFFNYFGIYDFANLIIRRVFYVPTFLHFKYFEFFSQTEFLYWSSSNFLFFKNYPYEVSPEQLIGQYTGMGLNANNTFLSTGYMHAGIFGSIFYAFIFVLLIRILDSLSREETLNWFYLSIILPSFISLIMSADLFVALFTHGILISYLIIFFFNKKKEM